MGRAGAGDVHAGSLPRRELNVHPRALSAAIFRPALAAFRPWNIARAQRYYESPALWKSADLVRHLVNSNFLYCVRGQQKSRQVAAGESLRLAGPTGLEPATSGVTGRRSNRLNYDPAVGNSLANLLCAGGIPEDGASYQASAKSRRSVKRATSQPRRMTKIAVTARSRVGVFVVPASQ
jgi:hypothetical protein